MIDVDNVAVKTVGGVRVLYVMATLAEYLTELRSRFSPLICQVGPVEAAMYVSAYLAANRDVDLVVSLGSAGSATLEQAHVYQVSAVAYRDMDASPFGFPKGVTPFSDLPPVIELGNEEYHAELVHPHGHDDDVHHDDGPEPAHDDGKADDKAEHDADAEGQHEDGDHDHAAHEHAGITI